MVGLGLSDISIFALVVVDGEMTRLLIESFALIYHIKTALNPIETIDIL